MKNYFTNVREDLAYYNVSDVDLQALLAIVTNKDDPILLKELCNIGIRRLAELSVVDLQEMGVTHAVACRVVAAFGLARKLAASRVDGKVILRSPQDAFNLLHERMRYLQHEEFVVLFLDTKNGLVGQETISKGSLNATIVHPREVFHAAVKRSSFSIICAHNHPSHDPTPSQEDISVTQRLVEAGNVMGIEVLDHIIVCETGFVSLKERGLI